MPVRLFTDAERERLYRFPRDISPADLLAFFTLSDNELELIGDRRGDHNRVGFRLQLKALPYLGFVPDDLGSAPARVVSYLALQLGVSSGAGARRGRGARSPAQAGTGPATLAYSYTRDLRAVEDSCRVTPLCCWPAISPAIAVPWERGRRCRLPN